ncbi:Transferrin [Gryllus bimaculatus]|nr:Transferrin [Gryllus bimaculatus]
MQLPAALALLLAAAALAGPTARTHHDFNLCVPEPYFAACQTMQQQEGSRLKCVKARDRVDCLEKVGHGQADIMAADPEDMYLATSADVPFTVFKEVRTTLEPTEEFRYEAVAVVHKNLQIESVQGIRGLKSCHTGVGRNVGYKIPITKLTKLGVLRLQNDSLLTAREIELRALSQLFSHACLVGDWSSDAAADRRLKNTYSNLCALCEHPDVCNYPDKFSGYDGALRCLSDGGGQVAWTKIPVGGALEVTNATRYNPNDYAYLCPDGSKRPILGPACRWAARPWQGFIANGDITSEVDDVRRVLDQACRSRRRPPNAEWLKSVLTVIKDKTVLVSAPQPPVSPLQYLDKANYTDVIGRGRGGAVVRVCVRSQAELAKCRSLAAAAFSRDVRPEFGCELREGGPHACLAAIRDGHADIIAVDGGEAHVARTEYNLRPVLTELYGEHQGLYYAVAVVKKSSSMRTLTDLRGKKSCHTGYGRTAGWNVPVYALLRAGLLPSGTCPYAKAVGEFFSGGSCVPGALSSENNPAGLNPQRLCDLCAGDLDAAGGANPATKCNSTPHESFYGYAGAFRCLASGAGDVAFVKHATVPDNTDGKNSAAWARNLQSSDYELLCPDGSRKPVDQYESCNLAQVPAHLDSATGFRAIDEPSPVQRQYEEMLEQLRTCN